MVEEQNGRQELSPTMIWKGLRPAALAYAGYS